MPEIEHETSILIDHMSGKVHVDTTKPHIARKFLRMGYEEITGPDSLHYRRLVGKEAEFHFRKKITQDLSPERREERRLSMQKLRNP